MTMTSLGIHTKKQDYSPNRTTVLLGTKIGQYVGSAVTADTNQI